MTMFSDDSDLVVFPARDAAFTVRTRLKDGSVRVAERPFEAMPDGALRARIPASEIDPGAEWVEIVHPRFRARRGDSGYWLGPRGQLGHFTRQTGCSWTTDVYNNFLHRAGHPRRGDQTPVRRLEAARALRHALPRRTSPALQHGAPDPLLGRDRNRRQLRARAAGARRRKRAAALLPRVPARRSGMKLIFVAVGICEQ